MKFSSSLLLAFVAVPLLSYAQDQGFSIDQLGWEIGPTTSSVGPEATLEVPANFGFLQAEDTAILMEMFENIPSDNERVFAPDDLRWFAVFEFDPVGYVEDDETLDADALLTSVRKGTQQANMAREQRGWSTMTILGWRFPPRYDEQSNLLEWAFLAKDDGTDEQIINYNTRLLGRSGVMQVVLVADPESLDQAVREFKSSLSGFAFVNGEKYADYRQGDHLAQIGLAALIAGGAAAAVKNKGVWAAIIGFFSVAWKYLAIAVIASFGWFRSLFKAKK